MLHETCILILIDILKLLFQSISYIVQCYSNKQKNIRKTFIMFEQNKFDVNELSCVCFKFYPFPKCVKINNSLKMLDTASKSSFHILS